ncbi:MAG: hypothetical protein OXU85_00205 [Thaumarchaeota archaeon]|nr:hypothetical protein [Nitrososphaerota archaeon]
MGRTDRMQAICLAGGLASAIAYAAWHSPLALAAFAACAAAFGAAAGLAGRGTGARRRAQGAGRAVRPRAAASRALGALRPRLWRALDPVVDAGALRRAYGRLNPNMGRSVVLAGVATNLGALRREAGVALVASLVLAVPLAVALATLSGRAELAAAAAIPPAAALFYPRAKLGLAAMERRVALSDEMTFFAVYCLLLSGVGKTMAHALDAVAGRGIFPALEREARVMRRGRTLGMGSIAALGDIGRNHPNRAFGDLLCGYVAAFGAGDPEAHLKSQVSELLGRMRRRLEAYKERASSLAIMVVFATVFLPIMITPVAVIAGPKSAVFLTQVSLLAMPSMAAMACILAHTAQPRFGDAIRLDWRIPIGLAALAAALAAIAVPAVWVVIAAASLAFSSSTVALTRGQRRLAAAIDGGQGMFFRDMTSRISSGDPSVSRALAGIVASGTSQYGRLFGAVLARAHARIRRADETVQEVLADTAHGSWLGRFSFFLLSRIADTGSVDAWILTRTTEFVERFVGAKRDVAAAVRPYMLVSAASPAAVVAMTWFLKGMLSGLPEVASGFGAGIGITQAGLGEEFDEATNALTMASATCANVAVGKISSMSVKDARPLLAGTIIAVLSILFMSAISTPGAALG